MNRAAAHAPGPATALESPRTPPAGLIAEGVAWMGTGSPVVVWAVQGPDRAVSVTVRRDDVTVLELRAAHLPDLLRALGRVAHALGVVCR